MFLRAHHYASNRCTTRYRFMGRFFFSSGPNDELERTYVDPSLIVQTLESCGVDYYAGVPDSLLKDFCGCISNSIPDSQHFIAPNEGSAVAAACGAHLATGKIPFVYMQNSGLGNAINPILSLADRRVYAIPMLVMLGWRGEPGKKDEPQHLVQGDVLPGMLAAMDLNFDILPDYSEGAVKCIEQSITSARQNTSPSIILVRKGTFSEYAYNFKTEFAKFPMSREVAIETVLTSINKFDVIVGTTGFTSREIFESRARHGSEHSRDFLTVGSMGHASAIALGIAAKKPSRDIYCIDGDGACLMHLGNMASVGRSSMENYKHILLNNGVHDSVGAQGTSVSGLDYSKVASSLGYSFAERVSTSEQLEIALQKLIEAKGPAFLEICIKPGARSDLGRPSTTTFENKEAFMKNLGE